MGSRRLVQAHGCPVRSPRGSSAFTHARVKAAFPRLRVLLGKCDWWCGAQICSIMPKASFPVPVRPTEEGPSIQSSLAPCSVRGQPPCSGPLAQATFPMGRPRPVAEHSKSDELETSSLHGPVSVPLSSSKDGGGEVQELPRGLGPREGSQPSHVPLCPRLRRPADQQRPAPLPPVTGSEPRDRPHRERDLSTLIPHVRSFLSPRLYFLFFFF